MIDTPYVKYPRTPHVPWSPGVGSDDRIIESLATLIEGEVVCTEKMDGENCLNGDTLISTPSGDKIIREICEDGGVSDIFSYNVDTNTVEIDQIVAGSVLPSCDDWYELELEDGRILRLTGDHQVWIVNEHQYRKVCDLIGDEEFLIL